MTPSALLADLRHRGVVLKVEDDDRLRVEAPRGALTPPLRAALTEQKPQIIEHLRREGGYVSKTAEPPDVMADDEIGAVLVYSHALDAEVWLVRDEEALADIALEAAGRPVFFFDEIETLRAKNPEELRAIAATKRVFGPGARVVH